MKKLTTQTNKVINALNEIGLYDEATKIFKQFLKACQDFIESFYLDTLVQEWICLI